MDPRSRENTESEGGVGADAEVEEEIDEEMVGEIEKSAGRKGITKNFPRNHILYIQFVHNGANSSHRNIANRTRNKNGTYLRAENRRIRKGMTSGASFAYSGSKEYFCLHSSHDSFLECFSQASRQS